MDSNLQGYINDYLDFIKKQDNYMSFGIFIKDQNSQEILEDEINSIFEDEYQDYLYPNDDLEDDDLKDDFQLSIEFRILESIYDLFHSILKSG